MKKRVFDILIRMLSLLDKGRLKRCNIGKSWNIDYEKYIPDDGKWHHFAVTIESWVKFDDKNTKIDEFKISSIERKFVDGIEADRKG